MRIIVILTAVLLGACATKSKQPSSQFSAPSVGAVATPIKDVRSSVARAKDRAAVIQKDGALRGSSVIRELEADLQEANLKAAQAEVALLDYSVKVEKQTSDLNHATDAKNTALAQAEYWHEKHAKALRELWMWRIVATIVVGSVLAFFGFRFAGKYLL